MVCRLHIFHTADIVATNACKFRKNRDDQLKRLSNVCVFLAVIYLMSMQPRRRSHHYRTRFVHMNTGEAANLVWTKATRLTPQIQYAREFGLSIILTDGDASNPGPRLRRRDPRSQAALALRLNGRSGRSTDAISKEMSEERQLWQYMNFRVLHVNIGGWIEHAAELVAKLRRLTKKPDRICD